MKGYFAQVRRAGFDIGLSVGTLTTAMVQVLSQLPPDVTPAKEVVVQHRARGGSIKQLVAEVRVRVRIQQRRLEARCP